MWNDQLGAGLQMALFDAVAKASDVPVYRLLGPKHRDRAFISWWDLDMAGDDWVLECGEALAQATLPSRPSLAPGGTWLKIAGLFPRRFRPTSPSMWTSTTSCLT